MPFVTEELRSAITEARQFEENEKYNDSVCMKECSGGVKESTFNKSLENDLEDSLHNSWKKSLEDSMKISWDKSSENSLEKYLDNSLRYSFGNSLNSSSQAFV